MSQTARRCLLALLALQVGGVALADVVQLAVAANFTAPMKLIAAEFEKNTGQVAILSFGSTGKLYSQIVNGAPFDVFLAADDVTPAKLEKDGIAVAGSRFTYATGRLLLWSASPGVVDGQGAVLSRGQFKHLAIAAPKVAPYGAAAIETLNSLGLLASLEARLVQGESIGQTFSMVSTGNAELGFVALSQIHEDGKIKRGSGWLVPASMHRPLRQDAVLLRRAAANPAAVQLIAFLKTEKARKVMRTFGYEP